MTTDENQPWSQVSPDLAKRPLVGVEKVLNYTEYYQNGNVRARVLSKREFDELAY